MKRIYTFIASAACIAAMTSCLHDSKEEFTRSFPTKPINIITNLEDGTTTTSTGGIYQFDLNFTDLTGTISTSNLVINNNSWNFTTNPGPFMSMNYSNALFYNPRGDINNNASLDLNNSTFFGTPNFYVNTSYAGDYTYVPDYGYVIAASYQIGDKYLVKTFQEDTFFAGETTTTYPYQGQTVTANPEGILYRIHLNLEKNKAALIMYDAKFSGVPQEPKKEVIIIDGLDVEFSKDGIVITGENIIPEIGESNATTPYPSYVFNSVRFETTDNLLTECKISYKVAGIYSGEFTGKYIRETLPAPGGSLENEQ